MKFIKEEIYKALQHQRAYNTSLTKAAEKYGVDRHTLSAYKNFDFSSCVYDADRHQYIKLTSQEWQAVKEYQNGTLPTVLAAKRKYGFHGDKFRKMCQYVGVETRQDNTKHHFNRNAFSSIQTEEDAYIRGLIDGDGFISKQHGHIGLCGSYDILSNVARQIAQHIDVAFAPERKLRCETTNCQKTIWRFELSGDAAKAAMRWLYEGSNIHLDRKFNLAKQYINLL